MNVFPVAGGDVSKRFSDMCILTPGNEVFDRVKIYHDTTSMDRALSFLQCAEQQFAAKPVIVMESTSHYHLILFQFFSDAGYEVIVVNPLQSNALKNINVRKIKTDKVDAYRLALLYRMNVLRRSQVPTEMLRSLRMLCRQHYELKGDITRYKNRLTALLDQIFPGLTKYSAIRPQRALWLYWSSAPLLAISLLQHLRSWHESYKKRAIKAVSMATVKRLYCSTSLNRPRGSASTPQGTRF